MSSFIYYSQSTKDWRELTKMNIIGEDKINSGSSSSEGENGERKNILPSEPPTLGPTLDSHKYFVAAKDP